MKTIKTEKLYTVELTGRDAELIESALAKYAEICIEEHDRINADDMRAEMLAEGREANDLRAMFAALICGEGETK